MAVTPSLAGAKIIDQCPFEETQQATMMISGRVTEDTFGEFLTFINKHPGIKQLNILIHTNGGDAYSTVGIMNKINELKKSGMKIKTVVHAKAYSAGGYLFLMGDERVVYEGSTLMFHTILQQRTRAQVAADRERSRNAAIGINVAERLDNFVRARFIEVTNCSEKVADYFLNGTKEEDTSAQWMSGLTAYNLGVATEYIKY
jgi:ATP-dependent protease ClpP protease subunit